ncbi:N/A [soil metagenome]
MRVLVTRPAAQAAEWVLRLREAGIDAVALPLIGIDSPADSAEVLAAWRSLASRRMAMFVSPNAADRFFASRPAGSTWPATTLAGSPGPGTTQGLIALGVPPEQIIEPAADAAQFDSESLWEQLRGLDWQGAQVLIVRGDGGRDWLATTLREHGAVVDDVTAYRRVAPVFDAAQTALLALALQEPAEHLWFFSSSEAIDHLARFTSQHMPPHRADWSRATAIATHPRIAARAQQLGFMRVVEARPSLEAVVACLQSIGP